MKSLILKSLSTRIEEGMFVQLLGSLCRSAVYVEYDDEEGRESRPQHLIFICPKLGESVECSSLLKRLRYACECARPVDWSQAPNPQGGKKAML